MSNENKPIANSIKEQTYYKGKNRGSQKNGAFCVGRTCLQPALDAHKFVFGVFYDRHCTDSCSDGSDFVFGLSNLGRSKRPYVGFFYRLKEAH